MAGRLPKLIGLGSFLVCGTIGAASAQGLEGDGVPRSVPRAVCGSEDNPETGLQGQVPAALRASGFKGFNCNLKLIAQSRNDGGNWQTTEFKERRQPVRDDGSYRDEDKPFHVCGYYGSQSPSRSPATRLPDALRFQSRAVLHRLRSN